MAGIAFREGSLQGSLACSPSPVERGHKKQQLWTAAAACRDSQRSWSPLLGQVGLSPESRSDFGPCPFSVSLSGERKTMVSCTRILNKTMTLANDSACQRVPRPAPQVRRCNAHPCQSR